MLLTPNSSHVSELLPANGGTIVTCAQQFRAKTNSDAMAMLQMRRRVAVFRSSDCERSRIQPRLVKRNFTEEGNTWEHEVQVR
jgi:hypothetical protein